MERVKYLLKEAIGLTLVSLFAKRKARESGVYSVYFHNPSKALFQKLILWFIRNNFQFLSLENFEEKYKSGELGNQKYILVTFDDGWVNNLKLVEVIEEYKIPIGIFIPTEPVTSGNYWWEFASVKNQVAHSGIENTSSFKRLDRDTFFEKINLLKQAYNLTRSCITVDELYKLSQHDLVTIGSHTVTHPILIRSDYEAQKFELTDSKSQLEGWIKKDVKYLAYPNGDYNNDTIEIAEEAGYKLCFTTEAQIIKDSTVSRYKIPRFSVNDHGGYYENLAKALGIWQSFFKQ